MRFRAWVWVLLIMATLFAPLLTNAPLLAVSKESNFFYYEQKDSFGQVDSGVCATGEDQCAGPGTSTGDYFRFSGKPTPNTTQFKGRAGGRAAFITVQDCNPSEGTLRISNDPEEKINVKGNAQDAGVKCEAPLDPSIPEADDTKKIKVDIALKTDGPNDKKIGPLKIELKTADGSSVLQTVEAPQVDNSANNVHLGSEFTGVEPGDYQVCVPQQNNACKPVTKTKGQIAVIDFSGDDAATGVYTSDSGDTSAECESTGGPFGWILCSVFNLAYEGVVFLYTKLIQPLLSFDLTSDTGREGNALREVWSNFRTIANIGFVIAFMFIIFAQSTSINVDAYTVKRMLPRLVIGVILVQLSFFIVAIAVDVFNVLGTGVNSLITAPLQASSIGFGPSINGETGALGVAALVGVGTAVGAGLFAISPLIIGVLLGVLIAVITLLFRQLLITLLVIIAPVAMVAWVLPNTEKMFRTWWDLLIKALLMYPLIQAFIALGELGGTVASQTFGEGEILGDVMGLMALIAPYLLIPFTFKFAGGALAGITAFAQGKARTGALGRFAEGRQAKSAQHRAELLAGSRFSERGLGKVFNRVGGGLGLGWRGRYGLGERGRQAATLRRGSAVEQTLKNNPMLQQLALNDDANALMALSGGSAGGALEAARELGFDEERTTRAMAAGRSVGFNRANAQAAMLTMAQYKSRSVGAGRFDAVETGVQRLAGSNAQAATDLAEQFQFHSRNAGRIDLGGAWHTIGGATPEERAHNVMRDGLARTEVPALVRGHPAQVQQAVLTVETMLNSADAAERQEGAVRLLELHSALPYANLESATIINGLKRDLEISPDENVADQLADGLRTGRIGQAIPGMTAQALQSEARAYDQQRSREELGGTGPGSAPPPTTPPPGGGGPGIP